MTSPAVEVLCFGPGLPPGGQRVAARIGPARLELDVAPGHVVAAPWFALQISIGGFDHQQMLLSWSEGDASWSAMPVDAAARAQLIRHAPAELQPRLAQWNKRVAHTRRGFKVGWAALGVIIASPLLLIGVFWLQSDHITQWVVDQISIDTERKLGEQSLAQVKTATTLYSDGVAVDAVRDIGAKLTAGSRYSYQWFVADDPSVNAFAMPGGFVVVNAGLINAADSAEEVAGVLAHEVQHVERRHSLKTLAQVVGLQAVLNLAMGDVTGNAWSGLAAQLGALKFSRDHEREADQLGLAALARAHVDGHGMLRFFEKLEKHDSKTIALFSTHPATVDRLQALQKMADAAEVSGVTPLPYDWASVKAALNARR